MNKIIELLISIPKTVYFNFKYFKSSQAIKLPVFISYNTKFKNLNGNIQLPKNIKTGIIKIGFGGVSIFDKQKRRTILDLNGKINFKGKANIGHGSSLSIGGELVIGDGFIITAESSVVCKKNITIGDNCLISWDCLLMDTDFHKIYGNDKQQLNIDEEIIIGNNVWIGCRNLILKGSLIGDNSVIGANSKVCSKFNADNILIGGNPANIIKYNISWEV